MLKNKRRKLIKTLLMTSFLLTQGVKGKLEVKDILDNYSNIENITYQEMNDKGCLTNNVNFRLGPGINYNSMKVLKKETVVNVLAKFDNNWYLVDYDNTMGFISSQYVKIIDVKKINKEILNLPTSYKILTAITEVNIREQPSIKSRKITTLKKNDKVIYSNKLDNGWYECIYDNKYCYVNENYVKEANIINGKCIKFVYFTKDAEIYNYPYDEEIVSIPRYELAKVYGEVEDYYYIETEGIVGFIKKSVCNELDDKVIVVDISSQTVTVYNNLNEILKSSIVSGKSSTPTDLGYYSIKSKEKNRTLIGIDYKTFVKYWMGFNGGEGFHDASWRNKFGGDIYIKNGSHGCVNLPEEVAKKLYNEVSIGDKVLVKK